MRIGVCVPIFIELLFPFPFSVLFLFLTPPPSPPPRALPTRSEYIVSSKFYCTNSFHSSPFLELISSFASGGLAIKCFISALELHADSPSPPAFECIIPLLSPQAAQRAPGGTSLGVCWCSGSASPPVNTESPAACPSPPGAAPGPWGLLQAPFGP